jgi:aminoglycoside phosphotransferase (APT) family kinase protein
MKEHKDLLRPLLDHLAEPNQPPVQTWSDWTITWISGGFNNLLYRAEGAAGNFAVKFTLRDQRDRAGREYMALLALQQAGFSITPEPILLDRDSYPQPVVVQTWLEGDVSPDPPTTDADWQSLLEHLAAISRFTPSYTSVPLSPANMNIDSVEAGRNFIHDQVALIPPQARPVSLEDLIRRFDKIVFPSWSEAPVALCRGDTNPSNFIRRSELWASVDWEYSGWGDPAFDIAETITHPAYLNVPPARWEWLIDTYCRLTKDPAAAVRIQVYTKIMRVWWVARWARALHDIPRGLDRRLTEQPDRDLVDRQAKYEHYLVAAHELLE